MTTQTTGTVAKSMKRGDIVARGGNAGLYVGTREDWSGSPGSPEAFVRMCAAFDAAN